MTRLFRSSLRQSFLCRGRSALITFAALDSATEVHAVSVEALSLAIKALQRQSCSYKFGTLTVGLHLPIRHWNAVMNDLRGDWIRSHSCTIVDSSDSLFLAEGASLRWDQETLFPNLPYSKLFVGKHGFPNSNSMP